MSNRLPDLEQLSSLLDQLQSADQAPPPERRGHSRAAAHDRVPVVVELPGQPAIHGTLRDISKGGVGLTLPVPLTIGATFVLRTHAGARAVRATCRVANSRPAGDGRLFIVGARILPPDPATSATTPWPATFAAPAARPVPDAYAAPEPIDVDQAQVDELRRRLAAAIGQV